MQELSLDELRELEKELNEKIEKLPEKSKLRGYYVQQSACVRLKMEILGHDK